MTRARLSQLDEWQLEHSGQDVRGWKVQSEDGHTFGTIDEMIVNTDTEYVDAFVLDDGTEVPADNIRLGNDAVYLLGVKPMAAGVRTQTADIDMPEEQAYAAREEREVDGQQDAVTIPIVAEQIRVGKRTVEGGGVRVNVDVEEVPVKEQVTLRDETIDVRREKVDRPISEAELANVQEGAFMVTATDEQAVVDKQARVVEEVVVHTDVEERTETIQDTVRRTEVDVEQLGDGARGT